jgi:hypothetical protein
MGILYIHEKIRESITTGSVEFWEDVEKSTNFVERSKNLWHIKLS